MNSNQKELLNGQVYFGTARVLLNVFKSASLILAKVICLSNRVMDQITNERMKKVDSNFVAFKIELKLTTSREQQFFNDLILKQV